jgi:hypothetical protein
MADKMAIFVLGLLAAALPSMASTPEPTPTTLPTTDSPSTQYCLRVGPYTGTRLESVQCLTRQEWAEQCDFDEWQPSCVDLDKEWARHGVRVVSRE